MLSLVRSLSPLPASILIVEDEALLRFLGVGMFADAGFRVIEAADSEGALEILAADSEVQLRLGARRASARPLAAHWYHCGFWKCDPATPRIARRLPLLPQTLRCGHRDRACPRIDGCVKGLPVLDTTWGIQ